MLDRFLFVIRRASLDLGRWLGSWRLSIVLMVLMAQYYAFLAIWSGSSPPHVVQNIAALVPFWLLYALLLVNAGVCLWNRIPALKRDLSRAPRFIERPAEWVVETPSITRAGAAQASLGQMGYRPVDLGDGRIGGVRNRWSALGTFFFHGAFFLVALGFLATFAARNEATLRVAVGEEYTAQPDQVVALSPPRIVASGVPSFRFKVESISPEFWRDELLFTKLESELELPGGRRATTRINRPLWIGPGTFLRLSGFGYAPLYELLSHDARVLDGAFVKLDVFPPGRRDFFNLPGYPHRIYLGVLPNLDDSEGEAVTKSLDLVRPAVELQVMRGRVDLGRALLRQGEGYEFEGMTLHFPEIRYWGEFSVVRDPGAPVLFLGYLVGLIGLLLRIRGKRAEIAWFPGGEGEPGTLKGWGDCAPPVPSNERPGSRVLLRLVDGLGACCVVLCLVAWVLRFREAGHLPLFGTYESALSLALAVLLVAALLRLWLRHRVLLWPTSCAIAAAVMIHGLRYDRTAYALTISERSWVVDVHAIVAWGAFAVFAATAGLALLLLARRIDPDKGQRWLVRSLGVGFALHSAMLASGSLYKFLLFGRAWSFDPIETLALVVWVSYGTLLHMHLFAGWSGRRLAGWSVALFLILTVSYRGIVYFPAWSTYHIFDMDLRIHVGGPESSGEEGPP